MIMLEDVKDRGKVELMLVVVSVCLPFSYLNVTCSFNIAAIIVSISGGILFVFSFRYYHWDEGFCNLRVEGVTIYNWEQIRSISKKHLSSHMYIVSTRNVAVPYSFLYRTAIYLLPFNLLYFTLNY
jgi:hypothetical protein